MTLDTFTDTKQRHFSETETEHGGGSTGADKVTPTLGGNAFHFLPNQSPPPYPQSSHTHKHTHTHTHTQTRTHTVRSQWSSGDSSDKTGNIYPDDKPKSSLTLLPVTNKSSGKSTTRFLTFKQEGNQMDASGQQTRLLSRSPSPEPRSFWIRPLIQDLCCAKSL